MPKESLHHEYDRLAEFLRSISLRLKLLAALKFLLLLPSIILLIFLGSLFVLEMKETFPYLPPLYSGIAIVSLGILFFLGAWQILSKSSGKRVARGLEEKFPELRDDVTNSLLLFEQLNNHRDSSPISKELIIAHLKKTAEEISTIHPHQVVGYKKALGHLKLLFPLLITVLVILVIDPSFVNRSLALILHPFSNIPIQKTSISVEPKGSVVLRGSPLVIRAFAKGYIPPSLSLSIWPEEGEVKRLKMELEGKDQFFYHIPSTQFSFRFQAFHNSDVSPIYNVRVIDPPDIGKITLTLIPPDYTGLPKETNENGQIEALKGTVVNLEAQATKRVKEGKVVLSQNNQLLLKVDGERLTGSLLVFYPGIYSIHLKDEMGFENPNPVSYPIRLILDKYPEGEIIRPEHDLEISGDEILPVHYTVRDDFGITRVRLNYQVGGKEDSINLKNIQQSRSIGPEIFKWDLASLALTPGEKILFRLEIWDNDSISGPKKAYSRTLTLSVRDERARAAREGEEAHQIAEALLDLLADQLEDQKNKNQLAGEIEEILTRVDKNLARMEKRAERFDLEALKRNLTSLKDRLPHEPKETTTQEMERLALLAEEISKKAKMNEVEAMAREIKNRQNRLMDFLKEFKGPLNREALEAIMKELKTLGELIRSVMEALIKLTPKLPEEFMNAPELQGFDFNDLLKDLEEIQQKLMAGDIQGALEAAQRLFQALSEMMALLGKVGSQVGMSSFERLQGEMARQTGELDKILMEQKEILSETEKIDRELKWEIEKEMEKRLDRSLSRMNETLEKLHHSPTEEQKDLIEELEKLLKAGNLEKFSALAEGLKKVFSEKSDDQKRIKELVDLIKSIVPQPNEVITPGQKEKFPELSKREENLRERTNHLREKLEMLAQLFPGMDSEILNNLKGATGDMGEASGNLRKEDAPSAIPPEQEAIKRLTQSQQAMQQMAQQIAQQMAMRMQANRWGYQWWGYDPRPGWYYGPWVPMPTQPQPEFNRPLEKGYTGIDREEFQLPSKDAYQVPKIFREKILESLKEGIPPQYKREVEKYFRGLTE